MFIFLKHGALDSPGKLVKTTDGWAPPRVLDSVTLQGGLRVSISTKGAGDGDAASWETML